MCKFASFVLTLEKAFWGQTESHTDIIEHHGLVEMGARGPNIIRIEITPPKGKPLAPIAEWIYNVDQDILPEWYDKDLTEQRARTALLLRSQQDNWFTVVGSVTDLVSTGGYGATVIGGYGATVTGGEFGVISIEYCCNHRDQYRRAIAEVDGVDILPNVPYVVVDGKLTRKVD